MVFEQIDKLKSEYTDKYVVVDETRPELLRFRNMTGTVKTVNMNGRALVQFDGLENIGWYDIGIDFLKVVDKPIEKPVVEKAKPAPKPKPKPAAEKKPAPSGGATSSADILAAARGGAAPTKPTAKTPMSPADILAAARGGAVPVAPKKEKPAPGPELPKPVAEEPKAAEPQADLTPSAIDNLPTQVADILEFCRKRDS